MVNTELTPEQSVERLMRNMRKAEEIEKELEEYSDYHNSKKDNLTPEESLERLKKNFERIDEIKKN